MRDAVNPLVVKWVGWPRLGLEVSGEGRRDSRGGGEPEGAAFNGDHVGFKVTGELVIERMNDETRVTGSKVRPRCRLFFLVTADVGHAREAARDGVRAVGDGLTERKRPKGGHGRSVKVQVFD